MLCSLYFVKALGGGVGGTYFLYRMLTRFGLGANLSCNLTTLLIMMEKYQFLYLFEYLSFIQGVYKDKLCNKTPCRSTQDDDDLMTLKSCLLEY